MDRYAITFAIRPGSEAAVAAVLGDYARPPTEVDADTRLLRTTVFLRGTTVVRVVDVEGFIGTVMAHLARQPEVQEVERLLNPHLVEPRDLDDADAARAFFARSMMQVLTQRSAPGAASRVGSRHALVYPVLPGRGPEVDAIVQAGGDPPAAARAASPLLGTTVFRKDDLVVRMFEIDGSLEGASDQLTRATPLLQAGRALQHLLAGTTDLTTEAGLRAFLVEQSMTVVTDRVAGRPAEAAR
jgi:hypothetical protein